MERVGGRAPMPVDVRLLAATNKDLEAEIAKGTFREDLYYRIKVIHIHMPPLRDIREEMPLLANHFLEEYCRETGEAADGVFARGAAQSDVRAVARQCAAVAQRSDAAGRLRARQP